MSSPNFALEMRFVLFLSVMAVASLVAPPSGGSDVPTATPSPSSAAAVSKRGPANVLWSENFGKQLAWRDPQDHAARLLGLVYAVQHESGTSFLRARHDATARGAAPAVHFGQTFDDLALGNVGLLRWRWRARVQPPIKDDPWQDMAAAIYVVVKAPSLLRKGRGFKFGWLARPGPSQTFQRGLLQVPQRSDPPSLEWKTEEVDLCALYRRTFGPCENEKIIYIGVLTDADGSKSIAEGDYADFEIVGTH